MGNHLIQVMAEELGRYQVLKNRHILPLIDFSMGFPLGEASVEVNAHSTEMEMGQKVINKY